MEKSNLFKLFKGQIFRLIIISLIKWLFFSLLIAAILAIFAKVLHKTLLPEQHLNSNLGVYTAIILIIAISETFFFVLYHKTVKQWTLLNIDLGWLQRLVFFVVFILGYLLSLVGIFITHFYDMHILLLAMSTIFLFVLGLLVIVPNVAKKDSKAKSNQFIPDKEIKDNLTLQQKDICNRLIKVIRDRDISSVSLVGAWGVGKTSVYRAAKEYIDQKEDKINDEVVWVEFYPWRYPSEEALILGLYQEIRINIGNRYPGTRYSLSEMMRAVRHLIGSTDNLTTTFTDVMSFLASQESSPNEYLNSILKKNDLYLVIVMDDIERNYKSDQIYRAFELAHYIKKLINSSA